MIKYEQITKGFTFNLHGKDVKIVTDYEEFDKNMTFVQIVNIETPKKSAGQFSKNEILEYLNLIV